MLALKNNENRNNFTTVREFSLATERSTGNANTDVVPVSTYELGLSAACNFVSAFSSKDIRESGDRLLRILLKSEEQDVKRVIPTIKGGNIAQHESLAVALLGMDGAAFRQHILPQYATVYNAADDSCKNRILSVFKGFILSEKLSAADIGRHFDTHHVETYLKILTGKSDGTYILYSDYRP